MSIYIQGVPKKRTFRIAINKQPRVNPPGAGLRGLTSCSESSRLTSNSESAILLGHPLYGLNFQKFFVSHFSHPRTLKNSRIPPMAALIDQEGSSSFFLTPNAPIIISIRQSFIISERRLELAGKLKFTRTRPCNFLPLCTFKGQLPFSG